MSNSLGSIPPYSWPPSQFWDGNTGSWSSFLLRVGTPAQSFKILPATNGNQILVPVPEGCQTSDPSNCGNLRGVLPFQGSPSKGFQKNQSSTWVSQGIYDLDVEDGLNLTGNADFGYDTVGLGIQNSNGLTLTTQLVGGIATKDFYLGEFGLGSKPTNLTSLDNPIPNYMQSLREQDRIPSLSYGYTAGAKYQGSGFLGSLTLGGYDASRFNGSTLSIPFSADDHRSLTVGVQSISASGTLSGQVAPLAKGEFFLLDSTVSDIWLPLPACQVFEESFGLTYDNRTDYYTVNASIHQQLLDLNPAVTFRFGAALLEGSVLSITLPYAAFDLQAASPYYPNATNYFPIRRAANSTQYTLGRTLLQEAFVIVDQERMNFTIAQATFDERAKPQLVAIQSLDNTSVANAEKAAGQPISHGVLAGVIIVAIIVVVLMTGLGIYLYRRKHRNHQSTDPSPELGSTQIQKSLEELSDEAIPAESEGDQSHQLELDGEMNRRVELEGGLRQRIELEGGVGQRPELEGTIPMAEMGLNQPHVLNFTIKQR